MKLIVKLPSRERPAQLLHVVGLYAQLCMDPGNTRILITLDKGDVCADKAFVKVLRASTGEVPIDVRIGPRTTKVGACNRDLPGTWPWEVLLLASDDMHPVEYGYDQVIRHHMGEQFPALDGCLMYHDGEQNELMTLPVVGRKWYDERGLYFQGYKAYRVDRELTIVATREGKLARVPQCIIRHLHPMHGTADNDLLYEHNRKAKAHDHALFAVREQQGFPR